MQVAPTEQEWRQLRNAYHGVNFDLCGLAGDVSYLYWALPHLPECTQQQLLKKEG